VPTDKHLPCGWPWLRARQVGESKRAVVSKVEDFGAFVTLTDTPLVSGLVHKSELSWDRIMTVDDVIREGGWWGRARPCACVWRGRGCSCAGGWVVGLWLFLCRWMGGGPAAVPVQVDGWWGCVRPCAGRWVVGPQLFLCTLVGPVSACIHTPTHLHTLPGARACKHTRTHTHTHT